MRIGRVGLAGCRRLLHRLLLDMPCLEDESHRSAGMLVDCATVYVVDHGAKQYDTHSHSESRGHGRRGSRTDASRCSGTGTNRGCRDYNGAGNRRGIARGRLGRSLPTDTRIQDYRYWLVTLLGHTDLQGFLADDAEAYRGTPCETIAKAHVGAGWLGFDGERLGPPARSGGTAGRGKSKGRQNGCQGASLGPWHQSRAPSRWVPDLSAADHAVLGTH
jgi:hypothetical protein